MSDWRIEELLPHTGPAILLDEIVNVTNNGLVAGVTVGARDPDHGNASLPAHVGIEFMAQACGAFSGLAARRAGMPPRMGFILGTRRFLATRPWFAGGERLLVRVDLVYRDNEVGVFDCAIESAGEVAATAQLIVAEPKDPAAPRDREDAPAHE